MTKLGFVILSHRCPEQTRRLIDRLVTMFDGPPIACHHDFSQSHLDVCNLPSTFRLVQPHRKTEWAEFSVIEATLLALRLLYQTDHPDWFAVLSGADYPIKPAEKILQDLQTTSADALMRYRLIDKSAPKHTWQRQCLRRYRRRSWQLRLGKPPPPFSRKFRCFAGSQFFTANVRCAEHLLAATPQHRRLARHYARVFCPEESFFQCLLCNAPQLRVANEHFRYIDWSSGGNHPKTLTCDDLPELTASPAHFARKFDIKQDAAVLDRLDEFILHPGTERHHSRVVIAQ